MLRSIIIVPKFSNIELLTELRKRYDPLADKVPPHITLVFPFESSYTQEELTEHIKKALIGFEPFEVRLRGISGSDKRYLFLNVKQGNDQIIALHDRLYTKILSKYLNRRVTYIPHLTVGQVEELDFLTALQETEDYNYEFRAIVDELIIELIDYNEVSHIEFQYKLES